MQSIWRFPSFYRVCKLMVDDVFSTLWEILQIIVEEDTEITMLCFLLLQSIDMDSFPSVLFIKIDSLYLSQNYYDTSFVP